MPNAWVWIEPAVIVAIHEEQLAEHGGPAGTRDHGLLQSALSRPLQLAHSGQPDAADLAASYAFGIARNSPFMDGNERTALVAAELFLALNGHRLAADDADCVSRMLALAASELVEASFAAAAAAPAAPPPVGAAQAATVEIHRTGTCAGYGQVPVAACAAPTRALVM